MMKMNWKNGPMVWTEIIEDFVQISIKLKSLKLMSWNKNKLSSLNDFGNTPIVFGK